MKKIFCSIICVLICSLVLSQSISENFRKNPIIINRVVPGSKPDSSYLLTVDKMGHKTVVHGSKPDSSYLKVTYTTEDNMGHKFVSIKGDENHYKFKYTLTITRKDSTGHKYKVLVGHLNAEFPGGLPAWGQYLREHLRSEFGNYIKIPEGEVSAKQTVIVQYTIDSLGNTADIIVLNENDVHPKLAEEAIRVIKNSPRWVPGLQEEFAFPDGANALHKIGNGVTTKYKQSINFESLRN